MSASVMLMGAVLASLAFGVLVAYGICQAMFRVFRVHSLSAARQREQLKLSPNPQVAVGR